MCVFVCVCVCVRVCVCVCVCVCVRMQLAPHSYTHPVKLALLGRENEVTLTGKLERSHVSDVVR
jgi:hypothetical protein